MTRLKITEIFHSLQGEADTAGIPTVFVRLTGCPLRCQYCDTAYAFHGGEWWQVDAIVARVREFATRYVCVTGGEPLAQRGCLELLERLCEAGLRVSLETSGAMALGEVDPRVIKVVDVKTPGSGEERRNRYEELAHLGAQDLVKFVICSRADYEWSRGRLRELSLAGRLHGAVLPEPRAAAGARARRLDSGGSAAGALPDPAAQVPVGQRAREVARPPQVPAQAAKSVPRAVVLLSGGLDSATALAIAREQGFACHALSVDYGQRHAAELEAARRVACAAAVRDHRVMRVDLAGIGGSALTDTAIAVPEQPTSGIPVTYVPARNTIMLALALAWAEVLEARDLFIGVNVLDSSGYPDCRPEFIRAFGSLAALATRPASRAARAACTPL